jgi:four helix bundle protein
VARIDRFEDLQSWQKARQLANQVYDLTMAESFAKDYELRNQIRRAAGSVMHNIVEGFDSGSDAEFSRFLRMARRSASEVQSQLCLALDRNYITSDEMQGAYALADETKKLINGLLAYLRKSNA